MLCRLTHGLRLLRRGLGGSVPSSRPPPTLCRTWWWAMKVGGWWHIHTTLLFLYNNMHAKLTTVVKTRLIVETPRSRSGILLYILPQFFRLYIDRSPTKIPTVKIFLSIFSLYTIEFHVLIHEPLAMTPCGYAGQLQS